MAAIVHLEGKAESGDTATPRGDAPGVKPSNGRVDYSDSIQADCKNSGPRGQRPRAPSTGVSKTVEPDSTEWPLAIVTDAAVSEENSDRPVARLRMFLKKIVRIFQNVSFVFGRIRRVYDNVASNDL